MGSTVVLAQPCAFATVSGFLGPGFMYPGVRTLRGSRQEGQTRESVTMLKGQKVQDTIQVLPQPGLQAEKIDVEVPRQNTVWRFPAEVFVGGTMTRVEKTPTHQAHLEGRDNRMEIVAAPLQASTSASSQRLPTCPAPSKKDLDPGREPPSRACISPGKTCISAQGTPLPQILLQGKKRQYCPGQHTSIQCLLTTRIP